jgi:hypothetical protein
MLLIAVIWISGIAAFFLYVPLLPIAGTSLVVFGFALMFVLGVHVGYKPDPAPIKKQ